MLSTSRSVFSPWIETSTPLSDALSNIIPRVSFLNILPCHTPGRFNETFYAPTNLYSAVTQSQANIDGSVDDESVSPLPFWIESICVN